jgi:hypothetical protein
MSQSPSRSRSEGQPEAGSGGPDTYFEDSTEEWTQLEEQREELAVRQEVLRRLDERVAKIDQDIGSASIEINDNSIIHVQTSTPDMCDEVKQLVHGYSWPRKSDIGYDTCSQCVTWSLKTDIDSLVEDHQQQIAE